MTEELRDENAKGHSNEVTRGVRVRAAACYMEEESDPAERRFLYGYRICLDNEGEETVQLVSRHWVIVDAQGRREEVRGDGVVGEQPTIAPGIPYEYTSGCPLRTEWGTMEGTYLFRNEAGEEFEVAVGRFFLAPNVSPIPGGLSV
jgi:ApaG protein|tara:strand:- start:200 stop:637 length:438 start_codon:yes stop_codon:yes gene_type:complete